MSLCKVAIEEKKKKEGKPAEKGVKGGCRKKWDVWKKKKFNGESEANMAKDLELNPKLFHLMRGK